MTVRVTQSVIFQTEKKQRLTMAPRNQNIIPIRKDGGRFFTGMWGWRFFFLGIFGFND